MAHLTYGLRNSLKAEPTSRGLSPGNVGGQKDNGCGDLGSAFKDLLGILSGAG